MAGQGYAQLFGHILDISDFFKKCSLYESPEEDERELKFSSSEITHNLHHFHHCFILLSHLLKQFYILGCKQLNVG